MTIQPNKIPAAGRDTLRALSGEEIAAVSGGLNPQPLPPKELRSFSTRSWQTSFLNFALPSFFRF